MKHPKVVYVCFEILHLNTEVRAVKKTKKTAKEFCRVSDFVPGSGRWFFVKYSAKE